MQINIKTKNLDLTPALKDYIEEKIGAIAKFLSRWDEGNVLESWVEIGRTSSHHHKGDVFRAVVDIRVPGKGLRAEDEDFDARVAIDRVRDKLKREAEKYKEMHG